VRNARHNLPWRGNSSKLIREMGQYRCGGTAKEEVMEDAIGQSVDTNSAPVGSNSVAETSTPSEKMLRQSEVNDIVGRAKQDAASRAVEQYKRSQSESAPQQSYSQQDSGNMSEERVRRMAGEEAQRLRDQWVSEARTKNETDSAQRIVKSFYDKMEAGKEKYEDFEKVTGELDYQAFPHVVQLLAEQIDNSHEVMYEFGKNALKMEQLERLAERSPRMAVAELRRLADSIKANESATNRRSPNAPLSQQRPSNVGTDSGSTLSMRDLKAKYRA
jgi:hypothetical protein